MLFEHDVKPHLSPAERAVLQLLLNGSRRWSQLKAETGLSKQGLSKAAKLLVDKGLVERDPEESKGRTPVIYKILQDRVAEIKEQLKEGTFNLDRYSRLRELVETTIKETKDPYVQYAMLLDLFAGWGNADLHFVQEQMTWAVVALLNNDPETFSLLRSAADRMYQRCFSYILEVAKKYPVAALAFIDASTKDPPHEDISDVIDDYYFARSLPDRDTILSGAANPTYQSRLPTMKLLKNIGRSMVAGKWRPKPGEFPMRERKQIQDMLGVIRKRRLAQKSKISLSGTTPS